MESETHLSRTVSERESGKQLLGLRDSWSDLREREGHDEKVQRTRLEAQERLPEVTSRVPICNPASATLHIHRVYTKPRQLCCEPKSNWLEHIRIQKILHAG